MSAEDLKLPDTSDEAAHDPMNEVAKTLCMSNPNGEKTTINEVTL